MKEQGRFDVWASGAAYERYMGRWSRLVAEEFTAWLDRAPALRWLDVGCGTGVLSSVVAARCRPRSVLGCDRSAEFIGAARATVGDAAHFVVADAMALPVRGAACDVAVSALALNFFPEPATAVAELVRVLRPGGLAAGYVWDYREGMGLLRHFWDAATQLDPAAAALDEGHRFPLCRPEPLRALWSDAGLVDVSVEPLQVPTLFGDFTDLWQPFLAGQGPAPGYVAALAPSDRDRLREALAASVPRLPDDSVALTARAWAVRGRKPGLDDRA